MIHLAVLIVPIIAIIAVTFVVFGIASGALLALTVIVFFFAYLTGCIRRWLEELHPKKYRTVITEYETPHLLEPAELGYLLDYRTKQQELLATTVVLLQKRVVELKKGADGRTFFLIHDDIKQAVSNIEVEVLAWLRSQKDDTWVNMGRNQRSSVGLQGDFEAAVKYSLVAKGYIHSTQGISLLPHSKVGYIVWIGATIAGLGFTLNNGAGIGITFQTLDTTIARVAGILLLTLLLPLCIQLFVLAYRKGAKRPFRLNTKAAEHWVDIVGYKLYLKTVEFPRLSERLDMSNESLPYCIALGLKIDIDSLLPETTT